MILDDAVKDAVSESLFRQRNSDLFRSMPRPVRVRPRVSASASVFDFFSDPRNFLDKSDFVVDTTTGELLRRQDLGFKPRFFKPGLS